MIKNVGHDDLLGKKGYRLTNKIPTIEKVNTKTRDDVKDITFKEYKKSYSGDKLIHKFRKDGKDYTSPQIYKRGDIIVEEDFRKVENYSYLKDSYYY